MKTLSLTQPYASLVMLGAKTIETRSWPTKHRGWLAIHAAKGFPGDMQRLCLQIPFIEALVVSDRANARTQFPKAVGKHLAPDWLPRGAVVAVVRVVACVQTHIVQNGDFYGYAPERPGRREQLIIPPLERAFGDYTPGRFAWVLQDVIPLPEPTPAKGSRRLWEWDASDHVQELISQEEEASRDPF